MKHLAVALIVIALLAADFCSHLWLDAEQAHGWAVCSTWGLVYAAWWFWHHRGQPTRDALPGASAAVDGEDA